MFNSYRLVIMLIGHRTAWPPKDALAGVRARRGGPGLLRPDGARQDPHGHRPRDPRDLGGPPREVPADRAAGAAARQGQAGGGARPAARRRGQGEAPGPGRVRLRALRRGRGEAPGPGRIGQLRGGVWYSPPTSSSADGARSSPTTSSRRPSSTAWCTTAGSWSSADPATGSRSLSC